MKNKLNITIDPKKVAEEKEIKLQEDTQENSQSPNTSQNVSMQGYKLSIFEQPLGDTQTQNCLKHKNNHKSTVKENKENLEMSKIKEESNVTKDVSNQHEEGEITKEYPGVIINIEPEKQSHKHNKKLKTLELNKKKQSNIYFSQKHK